QVVRHQDLAVAAGAGADADGRNLHGGGYFRGQLRGHALHDDGKGPGFLGGQGIVQDLGLVALHAEAAETADRLRRHADVAHDRNVGAGDGGDGGGAADAAFELDRVGAAFLEEPAGTFESLLWRYLKGHEGQIRHQETAADTASHQAGVVN